MARKAKKITKLVLMRQQRNMSRQELAHKTGISERMLQVWELGARDFSKTKYDTVAKIAKVLDCFCEDIVGIIDK